MTPVETTIALALPVVGALLAYAGLELQKARAARRVIQCLHKERAALLSECQELRHRLEKAQLDRDNARDG